MIRILVVDDHQIFRQGIVSLISAKEDFEVIAEASTGKEAIKLTGNLKPDVMILDMELPDMNGIDVAKQILAADLQTKIVFLTMYKEKGFLKMAEELGIKGYILKDDAFDDLQYAIKAVNRGEAYISSSFDNKKSSFLPKLPGQSLITNREKEIISLIAKGLTSREIADKLSRSIKTIETHRSNIMEKLKLNNMAEIVRYAFQSGLIGKDSDD